MTQLGVCTEKNSGRSRLLGFIHSNVLELFLGELSERQWDQRVVLAVSPEDWNSCCWRFEKLRRLVRPLSRQNETIRAHLFYLLLNGEPATEDGEASELVRGCESGSQGDGPPLTEPADYNPIRGDTLGDLLRNELIHLIPGSENPNFVFWACESKAEDIEPAEAS